MLQLKISLRLDCLRQPLQRALQTAARTRVDAVELNARNEAALRELSATGVRHLRKRLKDFNLNVSAVHFPTHRGYEEAAEIDRRVEATKRAMKLAYDLGAGLVINQLGQVDQAKGTAAWTMLVEVLTDLALYGQRVGALLAARTGPESANSLHELLPSLPDGGVGVDFDPAALIIGRCPVETSLRQLSRYVLNFRARDGVVDLGRGTGLEVQLGRGSADFPALFALLEEKGFQGYVAIERNSENDAALHCFQAVEYLKNMFH